MKAMCVKDGVLKNERGSMLIEALMTIIFIGITVTALVDLYVTVAQGTSQTYLVTEATLLGQNQMENIIRDLVDSTRGVSYVKNRSHYPVINAGDFNIVTTIDSIPSQYNTVNYYPICVSVSHGAIENVNLKMWITN